MGDEWPLRPSHPPRLEVQRTPQICRPFADTGNAQFNESIAWLPSQKVVSRSSQATCEGEAEHFPRSLCQSHAYKFDRMTSVEGYLWSLLGALQGWRPCAEPSIVDRCRSLADALFGGCS